MKYDVIIIGAGPIGLNFANTLARLDLNIALIEKSDESVLAKPAYDGRETALTHLTQKILNELDVWPLIGDENISLIKHAKVLNGNSDFSLHFDHREAGHENLGFMVSNHDIRRASYEAIKSFKNINLITGHAVSDVHTDDQQGTVILDDDTSLNASLIVAADSRFSKARQMMEIPTSVLDFKRSCIVTKMKIHGAHDDTAWECFHYDRTLAVLPLNDNHVSVVITLDAAQKDSILDLSKPEFNQDMIERTEGKYGKMELTEELFHYPLAGTYADQFYAKRFALIGDAAVGMHPVTAHGFNLGLRGQSTLGAEIAKTHKNGVDIGSKYVLERYNTQHRAHTRPMYLGTNALVKLYTRTSPSAKIARGALLRLGNILSPAKQLITNQLTESKG